MTTITRRQKIYYATDTESGYGGWYFMGRQKPMLKISNRFLLQSGFRVGDEVEVFYGKDTLIIKKLDKTT